jgi:hypothetical protein
VTELVMFVDFLLTEAAPESHPAEGQLTVGLLWDGFEIVGRFPAVVSFGGVAVLNLEEEHGVIEVEIRMALMRLGQQRAVFHDVFDVPPPDPEWPLLRVWAMPFAVNLVAEQDLDIELDVSVRHNAGWTWLANKSAAIRRFEIP